MFPLVQELAYQEPSQLFAAIAEREGSILLESAEQRLHCGRYSFIALDPFKILSAKQGDENPFDLLEQELANYPLKTLAGLPPFQGGVAGYWGYELAHHLESLARPAQDPMDFPDLLLGFYDLVLAFDTEEKQAWIFSSGYPAQGEQRLLRAQQRLEALVKDMSTWSLPAPTEQPLALTIRAAFPAQEYQAKVRQVIDYILAGDIFQANLSLPFYANLPPAYPPFEIYQDLRAHNPAPFAAYLNFSSLQIISASPERFLKLAEGEVETRPIKGTMARGKSLEEDEALAHQLLASEKDRSENVMIVDLLRNDLSRVCEDYSVEVPTLCGLESYASVHHLVSVVKGRLKEDLQALDLLKASFPGGSITGAPKWRAMDIITELEGRERGPYCGAIGYLGFDGVLDTSITIRTIYVKGEELFFQAGGAIVLDSCPEKEYEEVLLKAKALFKALGSDNDFIDR